MQMKSSSFNILNLTIKDLSKLISTREISPVDLIEATLERIARLNPVLNAFITVLEDSARQDAKNADAVNKRRQIQRTITRNPGLFEGSDICKRGKKY